MWPVRCDVPVAGIGINNKQQNPNHNKIYMIGGYVWVILRVCFDYMYQSIVTCN